MESFDLNIELLSSGFDKNWIRLKNYKSDNITVHFGDIEEALIEYISRTKVCLGCVAWLTNENILSALAGREVVSILVQKEDFLRPDYADPKVDWKAKQDSWKAKLKRMYDALPRGICQDDFRDVDIYLDDEQYKTVDYNQKKMLDMYKQTNINPGDISIFACWETRAIRSLGEINKLKAPAFPRMHHKFLLFCNNACEPYAVWTGSFNFTYNATQSLENGLFITDRYIVQAYWYEYVFNFINSESLDWNSEYNPTLRIGT